MTPYLRRGGALSSAVHIVVLLTLVVALPRPRLPEQEVEETAVTVEFEAAPTAVQRAPTPAPVPAPLPAPTATPEPPVPEPALPVTPPPPPAPAPPVVVPPAPVPPAPVPPAPTPPAPTPPVPRPPAPAPTPPAPEQIAPAPLPPPPVPPVPRTPPTPQAPPAPPQAAVPQPALPTPPAPRPAPPVQVPVPPSNSATSQPNPVRNPAPDSKSLDNTLDRLRAQLASKDPPRATPNSPRGGAPNGGTAGLDNALLTASVRRAIGDRLRECWTGDKNALDYDKQIVRLVILVDAGGTIRQADIALNDASRTSGGVARAFAERARRAALDAQCAQLPLPAALKGQNHTFEITFRP